MREKIKHFFKKHYKRTKNKFDEINSQVRKYISTNQATKPAAHSVGSVKIQSELKVL